MDTPGDRTATDGLVRELHRRVLTHVLYADEGDLDAADVPCGGFVLLHPGHDLLELDPPDPDDHRVAHVAREACSRILAASPQAAAAAVTLKGLPDPHEVVVVVAAHRDGTVLASAMHAVPTSDGVLAPGPLVELDEVARELPATLVAALRAS